jgi:hypothetical protein
MGSHRIVARSSLHTSLSQNTRSKTAAHHEPRQGAQKLCRPRSRRPAHPHQLPRPQNASVRGDEGPHLGEGGGALDGPVGGFLERGGGGGGHGCFWFVWQIA